MFLNILEIVKVMWLIFWKFWPLWVILLVIFAIRLFFNWLGLGIDNWRIHRKIPFNRNKPTPEAQKLGRLLESYGWKVELEKFDGYKHIDIAITEAKVNIEVDGNQHNLNPKIAFADLERTYYSFKKGFITLRIPNILMRDNTTIEETAKFIDKFLRESDKQLEYN